MTFAYTIGRIGRTGFASLREPPRMLRLTMWQQSERR